MNEAGPLKEFLIPNPFHVPEVVYMSWIVMALIIVFFIIVRLTLKTLPRGAQNVTEFFLEWIIKRAEEYMGKEGPRFLPLFALLFLFIFISNLLGLIPGFKSPTSNINVTLGLGLIIFCATHYFGIKAKGFFGYFKHFAGPPFWLAPLLFPIHIIGELIRPLSLAFRLFGNILAKEILLGILATLLVTFAFTDMPWIVQKMLETGSLILRPLIMVLGGLVCFIQALVFTMLAMVYIAGAVSTSEEH